MPSPMRGRWHGEAVTDEVGAVSSTQRCPPHQSACGRQLPLIGEGIGCLQIHKTSPQEGADQQIGSAPSIYGSRSKVTRVYLKTGDVTGSEEFSR